MRLLPANGDGDSVNHESGEQLGVRERASHFCLCRSIICLCELEKRKLKATAKRPVDSSSMEKPFAAANESSLLSLSRRVPLVL